MFDRVFISYASEDLQYAVKLYDFLAEKNFRPWMDKLNLLPGQNWDFIIQQELRKSDFIILLLSNISVSKRGYVQKEFTYALKYCEEKLDNDIYIIPILIDTCEVPSNLSRFHWIEYSKDASFEKILTSLNTQRINLIEEKRRREANIIGFAFTDKNIIGEYGTKSPKQTYEIYYPLFNDINNESLHELNISIESEVLDFLKEARNNYFEFLKDFSEEEESLMSIDSTLYVQIVFQTLTNKLVSYTTFFSQYISGAVHGYYGTAGHNMLINPVRDINIDDLFHDFNESATKLRDLVHEKLMQKAKKELDITEPEQFYILEEGLTTKKNNFENFYFKNNSIVFIYNPYHLTAYAFGDHHPEISFDELLENFGHEKKLIELINLMKNK